MSDLLRVEGVTRRFGGLIAVSNVSFGILPGTSTGILGPNGAGKTTLFNLLSGFIPVNAGQIWFDGHNITGLQPHQIANAGLARTFQLPRPFTGMNVLENVLVGCLGARAQRMLSGSAEAEAGRLLERVGLAERRDDDVSLLSYGDLRRLDIARALATHPRLLLLDEPLAGLGAAEIAPIANLLRDLRSSHELAVVIIEHKVREFMRIVDHVIALDFGCVIAEGTPAEIVRNERVLKAYFGGDEVASDV